VRVRDLTWLSGVQGSSRAAAHARFVMAHRIGRELREHARHEKLPTPARVDEEIQQTLAILFPQQYSATTVRWSGPARESGTCA
jgi:hypothetical protein